MSGTPWASVVSSAASQVDIAIALLPLYRARLGKLDDVAMNEAIAAAMESAAK